MFIAMSAYDFGYATGAAVITGLGIVLILYAAKRLKFTKIDSPVTPPPSLSQSQPAAPGAPADEFFFADPVLTPMPPPTPGTNPSAAETGWYPDYSTQGSVSAQPQQTSWSIGAIALLILGLALATSTLVNGYQHFFATRRTIEMPGEILGMQRIDPDSDLGRQIEAAWPEPPTLPGGETLDVAAYVSGSRVLIVLAGESAPSNPADVDAFFAGFENGLEQGGAELTLSEVDPGHLGGETKCTGITPDSGACAWVDDDTVGMVIVAATGLDVPDTARQAREAVEH